MRSLKTSTESGSRATSTEQWAQLDEYPGYAVSDHGRVINTKTDIIKRPSCNQFGILMVNMSIDGRQCVRSVSKLVADIFMADEDRPPHFDTTIHLDGDKTNCAVWNMAWRPRWFAVKYHRQFSPHERSTRYGSRHPVRIVETGEEFPNSWEAAIKYGLLDFDIFLSMQNNTVTWPLNMRFEEIIS